MVVIKWNSSVSCRKCVVVAMKWNDSYRKLYVADSLSDMCN